VFDAVADRLADGRRRLVGDRLTAADLTFAALAAAVLMPPEYSVPLPQPDELPAAMAATVRELREHPAGAYALELFRTERARQPRAAAASGAGAGA
jgi:glutathione S-transferase